MDAAHSEVTFKVRYLVGKVSGSFGTFSGTVVVDERNPAKSSVEFTIQAASINTNEPQRDNHLRSADFFEAETYPHLTFKSTRVEKVDENNGRIYGELTIRNVTRPVVLETEYNGQAKSPWGSTSAGFTANTNINRKDWNLVWNQALETGGVLVGDEIKIHIELEIVKVAQETAEAASVA